MLKKTIASLAALVLPLIAAVAITASPAHAEASALTGTLELYAQPNFGGTAVTSTGAAGTCVKPSFSLPGGGTTNIIQSARITGANATMVVDLMSGENCGGTLTQRVTGADSAPVVPAGTARSALILFA